MSWTVSFAELRRMGFGPDPKGLGRLDNSVAVRFDRMR